MNRSATGSEGIDHDVARQIRLLREQQKFSQQDLAEASGLSRNTLSLLERGRTSPTLATLQKIADALKVDISAFFRKAFRPSAIHNEAGIDLQVPIPMKSSSDGEACRIDRLISTRILRIEPGAYSGSLLSHHGEEVIYCLSGKCLYSVDEQSYLLEPGDSLLFDGRLPHSCQNPGQKLAEALVILLDIVH